MSRARVLADYVSSGDELADKAPIAGPTFTGTVAIPNVANLETAVVANTAKVTNSTNASDLASGTVADARMPNLTGAITTVEGAVATTIADDAVGSDELANDVVINTSGAITTTGLATVAKIVETGGALKENLITNSGFDVWSNSVLDGGVSGTNAHTSGRQTDFVVSSIVTGNNSTFAGAGNWNLGSAAPWSITAGVMRGSSSTDNATLAISGLVVGKLYKAVIVISAYTSGNLNFYLTSIGHTNFITAAGDFSFTFKATATTDTLIINGGAPCNLDISDVFVDEVAPGCVDANYLCADGWFKQSAVDTRRESTETHSGSLYSLKVLGIAASMDVNYNPPGQSTAGSPWLAKCAGRKLTFGAWVKTAGGSDNVKLGFYDNSSYSYSSANTGTGWNWLEITQTATATTNFYPIIWVDTGETAYISQPMLVFGSSIGSGNYTRPQGEIINCETQITISPLDGAATVSSDTNYDLEVSTNGKIPKGIKALTLRGFKTPNAIGNYFGIYSDTGWQYLTYSPTANNETLHAKCVIDSNQNLEIVRNATFTAVHIAVNAVELY